MNLEITEESGNRLLHRTELVCVVKGEKKTPSRNELIRQIAAKKGVKEGLVVVDRVDQEFGNSSAKVYAKIYESEKAAQSVEQKFIMARQEKAMKGKESPAEEKKEA